MAKKQEIQDKRYELYERAHTKEYYAVAKWLSEVSFAPAVLGADQADVWRKIEKLSELYEDAINAERARNAKLEPRYAGAFPFVIKINNSVPIPFISSTIDAGIPNSIGTRTEALNIANVCCKLSGIHCPIGGLSLIPITFLSIYISPFSSPSCDFTRYLLYQKTNKKASI